MASCGGTQPDGSVEIALVHRPKYDDWSVPKGKLKRREHLLLGALREVAEETGADATLGRPLGEIRYLKDGLPKRVRYWAMTGPASRDRVRRGRRDGRGRPAALAEPQPTRCRC